MRELSRGVLGSMFCVLAALSGCAGKPTDVEGVLQLALQATTASGHVYRLRNATFQITGAASRTLSSEASPSTTTALLANLPIGSYSIALQPGWTLARVDAAGSEQTVSAQLLSAGTMPFNIQDQQLTSVTFTFETDGTLVMLGEGSLGVGIAVNERDGGTGGTFTLNVVLSGSGQVTSGAATPGIACTPSPSTADCTQAYPAGTSVSLTATLPAPGATVQWSGDCAATGSLTAVVVMSANRTCTATFSDPMTPNNFTLNVVLSGDGQVTSGAATPGIACTPSPSTADCTQAYPAGTSVSLTATLPAPGATVQWSGDCAATGSLTAVVVMSANRTCTATFTTGMTTPAFVAAGEGAEGTGDLVVPYPAGVSAGQMLVLQVGTRSTNIPTTPTGWTPLFADESLNAHQRLYFKTATLTEPATLSVVCGASNVNVGRMYAFSGVRAAPFTEAATLVTDLDGTLPGPTVAAAGVRRLAVAFVALDNNQPMAPFTGASGATWTEPVPEFGSGLGNNFSLQLQVASLTTSLTVSGGTANFGGSSDASVGRAFALIGN